MIIPIEGRAFLDAVAVGEDYNPRDYDELVGGGKFIGYDTFPKWSGRHFPTGISHAAGRYQFQPATWAMAQIRTGVQDFTPDSQDTAAWWLAQHDYHTKTGQDLLHSLQMRNLSTVWRNLQTTWASLSISFPDRYLGALSARFAIIDGHNTDD